MLAAVADPPVRVILWAGYGAKAAARRMVAVWLLKTVFVFVIVNVVLKIGP